VYQYRRQIAKQVRPSRTAFKNIPPNLRGRRSKSQTDCQGSRKSPETFDTYEVTLAVIKNRYKKQARKISSRGHRIRLPLAREIRNPRRVSLLKSALQLAHSSEKSPIRLHQRKRELLVQMLNLPPTRVKERYSLTFRVSFASAASLSAIATALDFPGNWRYTSPRFSFSDGALSTAKTFAPDFGQIRCRKVQITLHSLDHALSSLSRVAQDQVRIRTDLKNSCVNSIVLDFGATKSFTALLPVSL
jgi:hypothetical protein